MSNIQLDVLAIAAHRDDIEITSGGLMIKFADLGYKTGALDFTRGEMGSNGDADTREREANAATRVMGLIVRENLGLPDADVEFNRENIIKVVRVLRKYRPKLVILPNKEQRHPDHFHCYEIAKEACFFAGLKKLDCEGEPFRPHKILFATYYRDVEPSFVVDITDQYERKIEAIKCYASQFNAKSSINQIFVPGIDVFEYIRTRDRTYGMQIRKPYAEPYIITERISIDDPLKIPNPSI